MKVMIVEDHPDFLSIIREMKIHSLVLAENAYDALEQLKTGTIGFVYCDYHGINKNGKTAHDVIQYCLDNNIACKLTSNDPFAVAELTQHFGIGFTDKLSMINAVQGNAS